MKFEDQVIRIEARGPRLVALPMFVALAVGTVWAATPASTPRRISERLWDAGKYVQDGAGAPKLLVVYPESATRLTHDQELTRYAGRVEPADAKVYLDGTEITVYSGGVFTGLLTVRSGSRSVEFSARAGGGTTSVRRTVERSRPPEPLSHRPLRFGAVTPAGAQSFLLGSGSGFDVAVEASPGNLARVRIGSGGGWWSMQEMQPGKYSARIMIDDSVSPNVEQALEFQLRGAGEGGGAEPVGKTSSIRVRRMMEGERLPGVVKADLATFLKSERDWERWGNWMKGTPFAALERHGERYRVDFGAGTPGFVEAEAVDMMGGAGADPRIGLGEARVKFWGNPEIDRVTVEWDAAFPVAHVFETIGGPSGRELRVELIGALAAESASYRAPGEVGGGIGRVDISDAGPGQAPEVRVAISPGDLWGYGFSMPDATTLRLTVRTKPRVAVKNAGRPLEGLTIMVDAGHGGSDMGALGPSGLTEADVNLVLSALLGDRLEALGASVVQLRADDRDVSLDARVAEALRIEPDLFLSVHHNSVGFRTHPMTDRGPKVFYHYPHSIPVAARVAARLSELLEPGATPDVLAQVFRVNRNVSPCPSILIEGGFVCHPEDEIRLRDQATLERMAGAIASGVLDVVGTP